MNFIIYEDEKEYAKRYINAIHKLLGPTSLNYEIIGINEYNEENEKLLEEIGGNKVYILDIELGDISGLEIASEIREQASESIILFLTSHSEHKNDIFYSRLLAIDYISKDRLWKDRFASTLVYIIKMINRRRVLAFEFSHNSYRVPLDNILYIEKIQDNQKCIINTENGEQFEIIITISALLKKLGPNFFKSHKSCIINVDKIKKINYADNTITFTNNECVYLLSNRKKKQLREYVANY